MCGLIKKTFWVRLKLEEFKLNTHWISNEKGTHTEGFFCVMARKSLGDRFQGKSVGLTPCGLDLKSSSRVEELLLSTSWSDAGCNWTVDEEEFVADDTREPLVLPGGVFRGGSGKTNPLLFTFAFLGDFFLRKNITIIANRNIQLPPEHTERHTAPENLSSLLQCGSQLIRGQRTEELPPGLFLCVCYLNPPHPRTGDQRKRGLCGKGHRDAAAVWFLLWCIREWGID